MTSSAERLVALDADEIGTLRAAVDCLVPEDEEPGAVALGIVDRVATTLGGAPARLAIARTGLRGLDAAAQSLHGVAFADGARAAQEEILRRFQRNDPPGGTWVETTAQQFFRQLRADVVDAYYADARVWRLVGYPGYSMPLGYPDGGPCGASQEDER